MGAAASSGESAAEGREAERFENGGDEEAVIVLRLRGGLDATDSLGGLETIGLGMSKPRAAPATK